jgi:hypothetical protein
MFELLTALDGGKSLTNLESNISICMSPLEDTTHSYSRMSPTVAAHPATLLFVILNA